MNIKRTVSKLLLGLGFWINQREITSNLQQEALGQYLSSWPYNLPYEFVLEILLNLELNAEHISICEPFEYHGFEEVAQLIKENYALRLNSLLGD